ncbi:MAG: ATP-binding protein [Bacteroidota bacterium]
MVDISTKGKSPFYPGQPVPYEFFTGRKKEIDRIERAISQVALGKPQAIFLTGEFGIGKSSLASYMKLIAEKKYNLFGIHVILGGIQKTDEIGAKVLESVLKNEAYERNNTEKVRGFLSKYVSELEVFGVKINLDQIKKDSAEISNGILPFLKTIKDKLNDAGVKGILLILDEINGITKNAQFAHYIKSIVDENALSSEPLPLLLMLSGVEERRKEMIEKHQPVDRIFDIVNIDPLSTSEMEEFFKKAFASVNTKIEDLALHSLCRYSEGFPKIMHINGENTFWADHDRVISLEDVTDGIIQSMEEIGAKFVDQQVYKALKSKDYQTILQKLSKEDNIDMSFFKSDIEKKLAPNEQKKFNNFLQKMKSLNVIKSGDEKGEYVFLSRLTKLCVGIYPLEAKQK